MKQTNNILLPNQAPMGLSRDLDGNVLISFQEKTARLSPQNAYYLAVSLLKAVGCDVNEFPAQRAGELGGGLLKQSIKIA